MPCSAQPACDANHVTSRRCWVFARRLLRACADWWRDICLFLTVQTQTQEIILSSLFDLGQQASSTIFFNVDVFSSISSQVFSLNFIYS